MPEHPARGGRDRWAAPRCLRTPGLSSRLPSRKQAHYARTGEGGDKRRAIADILPGHKPAKAGCRAGTDGAYAPAMRFPSVQGSAVALPGEMRLCGEVERGPMVRALAG